jgi:hypothetical protein
VKERASQARRDETKTRAKRRHEAPGNAGKPITRPYATLYHDAYDDIVEASFPASDPPPYVRDPAASSRLTTQHHTRSRAQEGYP